MKAEEREGGVGPMVMVAGGCGGLFVLVCVAAVLFFFIVSPSSVSTTGGSGSSSGIEAELVRLSATRGADERYTILVQVEKRDSWTWTDIRVEDVRIEGARDASGSAVSAGARLVTPLPSTDVEESFELEFLTDPLVGIDVDTILRFELGLKASRHFGLSGGSRSTTQIIHLLSEAEPAGAAEVTPK